MKGVKDTGRIQTPAIISEPDGDKAKSDPVVTKPAEPGMAPVEIGSADPGHAGRIAHVAKAVEADPALGSVDQVVANVAKNTLAGVEAVKQADASPALLALRLQLEDTHEFDENKSKLWDAKIHETSTEGVRKDEYYYRGMRLGLDTLKAMAQSGMVTTRPDSSSVCINATSHPSDAFVFALTGGYNAWKGENHGPEKDFYSVIFEIEGVGKDLPFAWNTHGPSYSTDRLFITEPVPPGLVTGMWVYAKKDQTFRDFTEQWKAWTEQ